MGWILRVGDAQKIVSSKATADHVDDLQPTVFKNSVNWNETVDDADDKEIHCTKDSYMHIMVLQEAICL